MEKRNAKGSLKYNWEDLFTRWVKSGLKKDEFLKAEGINPNGMIAKKKTETWLTDLKKTAEVLRKEAKDDQIDQAIAALDGEQSKPAPGHVLKEIWQIVMQWRGKQAESDYKLADVIRLHAKVLLKNSMITKIDVNGKEVVMSTLRPADLVSLAKVAETVQRVQRLALGLSTENIGVDRNLEIDTQDNIPVFEVQVNDKGKFVNIR
jgi:hypothetical protein